MESVEETGLAGGRCDVCHPSRFVAGRSPRTVPPGHCVDRGSLWWFAAGPAPTQLVEFAAKVAHTEGWLTYDPTTTGCRVPTAPTCQTPDGWQRDQVKLPVFFLARRRWRR
jgi:hypothetical protein